MQNPCGVRSGVGFPWSVRVWGAMLTAWYFLKSSAIYIQSTSWCSLHSLNGNDDFILQQDLASTLTAKSSTSWFSDHGITVPDLSDRKSMGYCQGEDERHQTQRCRWTESSHQSHQRVLGSTNFVLKTFFFDWSDVIFSLWDINF